jgi:hypothetical protein
MAYEISEGSAAAALLLSNTELKELNTDNLMAYAAKIHGLVKDGNSIKMSGPERVQYTKWFDPANINDAGLTAIVHGVSAAKGIKKWFKSSQNEESTDTVDNGKVYLTGGVWDSDIQFLQVKVGDWSDYNSSDLVVIKGDCYYGVSLKKKEKISSANPPMINKSVVALLTELGSKKIADDFYKSRIDFFGGIVDNQIKSGALKGSIAKGISKENLFKTVVRHPYKSNEWVNLIDLKGNGALNLNSSTTKYEWVANRESFVRGVKTKTYEEFKKDPRVRMLFGYDPKTPNPKPISATGWAMRSNVNRKLGNINALYDKILAIANKNDLAEGIGKHLVSAVLKTELQENIERLPEIKKGKHFGFALVTALGKVSKGKITALPNDAIVKNNPTIQSVLGNMMRAVKKGKWKIRIDKALTEKKRKDAENKGNAPPAKLFFIVGIGNHDILDLEVRYKGSFSPSPQFLGGITKSFEKALESKDDKVQYKFGKACG